MQRQQGGLVPIGGSLGRSTRPGPGAPRNPTTGAAGLHRCRSGKPIGRGQRSGPGDGLHGADDGALFVAPHQPRPPERVQARQRPLHALHDRYRRQQAPLRQLATPLAGLGLDRGRPHAVPRADPGNQQHQRGRSRGTNPAPQSNEAAVRLHRFAALPRKCWDASGRSWRTGYAGSGFRWEKRIPKRREGSRAWREKSTAAIWKGQRDGRVRRRGGTPSQCMTVTVAETGTGSSARRRRSGWSRCGSSTESKLTRR